MVEGDTRPDVAGDARCRVDTADGDVVRDVVRNAVRDARRDPGRGYNLR